ncbi:MAG TPA: hypothetical protein VK970_04350 [Candidatus Methylacidiphilales bacterium]|nr:hypothetical protein [Candidatus Methylacidiphilales bacterium]
MPDIRDDIQAARQALPLPDLLRHYGLGDRVEGGPSPFRDGDNPGAFGLFRKDNGDWNWKDFVTGDFGDEIDFIAKMESRSPEEARNKYFELAGVRRSGTGTGTSAGTGAGTRGEPPITIKRTKNAPGPASLPKLPKLRRRCEAEGSSKSISITYSPTTAARSPSADALVDADADSDSDCVRDSGSESQRDSALIPGSQQQRPQPKLQGQPFDWAACIEALAPRVEEVAQWRGFSTEFVESLRGNGLIGLYKGCVAFPVTDAEGALAACHYRKEDGSWRFEPRGTRVAPLILGDPAQAAEIYIFESQWDALAVADRLGWHEGRVGAAFIITRGASNGGLVAGLLNPQARVTVFPQNDPPKRDGRSPAEQWFADIVKAAEGHALYRVAIPREHKDANDWLRAGVEIISGDAHGPGTALSITVPAVDEKALWDAIAAAENANPVHRQLFHREFCIDRPPKRTRPVLWLADVGIAKQDDLVAISAQVKSGKSAVIGAIMAALIAQNDMEHEDMSTASVNGDTAEVTENAQDEDDTEAGSESETAAQSEAAEDQADVYFHGDADTEPQAVPRDFLGFRGLLDPAASILHFDTEQSPEDHYDLVTRSLRRAGMARPPAVLRSFCLTDLHVDQRMAAIQFALQTITGPIGAVIIDGVADLCHDVNDAEEANNLVDTLYSWAIRHAAPIICVLHENPGSAIGKTRGHLGSQLERKAATNLRMDKDCNGIIEIYTEKARRGFIGKGHGPCFTWSDEAMMHVSCPSRSTQKSEIKNKERARILFEVACDVFQGRTSMRWNEIIEGIMQREAKSKDTAKRRLDEMQRHKILTYWTATHAYALNRAFTVG